MYLQNLDTSLSNAAMRPKISFAFSEVHWGYAPLGSSLNLNFLIKVPIPGFLSHWKGGGEHFPWGDLMPENWKTKNICPNHFPDFNLGIFFLTIYYKKSN